METSNKRSVPDLGSLLVQSGLVTQSQIDECLLIQHDRGKEGGTVPRLGEILVMKGLIRPEQLIHILSQQRMELRFCPRCVIRVNVAIRQDAALYRCARCRGPLVPAPPEGPVEAQDEDVIVVSRDPLPADVEAVSKDSSRKFGKYLILRELGRGGVGRIDLSWDTFLHQYVALKRILALRSEEAQQIRETRTLSLIKEARNMIRLRHSGIVTVFDVGWIGHEIYMSMEYLEGGTLLDVCEASQKRGYASPYFEDPRRILRILSESARAVHYAHTRPQPIIHCDLKPANIIIDAEGGPHILDFGMARRLRENDEDGTISGTPAYMSPEQCSGSVKEIDPRTDVFALGAILYHLLTGRPPFQGSDVEILYKTLSESPSSPTDILRHEPGGDRVSTRKLLRIPRQLEDLCMRCLERDRDKRPPSMEAIAKILEELHGAKDARNHVTVSEG